MAFVSAAASAAFACRLTAQESSHPPETAPAATSQTRSAGNDAHRFWDRTNDWLFTGVAASRTLDYFSTLNMRRRGRQEILLANDAVDNHVGFAAIEAASTGISFGAA